MDLGGPPSPRGPNSLNFMQFLGKFDLIVCWHPLEGKFGQTLDPPPRQAHTSWPGQTSQADTPPFPSDGYCCGRYASYWNAFLFLYIQLYCEAIEAKYIEVCGVD